MLNINILDVQSVFKKIAEDYPDISIERVNMGSAPLLCLPIIVDLPGFISNVIAPYSFV